MNLWTVKTAKELKNLSIKRLSLIFTKVLVRPQSLVWTFAYSTFLLGIAVFSVWIFNNKGTVHTYTFPVLFGAIAIVFLGVIPAIIISLSIIIMTWLISHDTKVYLHPYDTLNQIITYFIILFIITTLIYIIKVLYIRSESTLQDELDIRRNQDLISTMISHDLRTPLSIIIGCADLIEENIKGKKNINNQEKIGAIIDQMKGSGNDILQLLEDILDVKNFEKGKLRIEQSRINLIEVIEQLVSSIQVVADKKGIKILTKLEGRAWVVGDLKRIKQIFYNIIGNSIKYSLPLGEIDISNTFDSQYIIIKISDEGAGIHDDYLVKIFTPFFTSNYLPGLGEKSTGFGLPISKKIATSHGGDIYIENNTHGGVSVYVKLPFIKA